MDINKILAKIDEAKKPLKLSDRALSLKASGSTELIRNWRRAAAAGTPITGNGRSLSEVAQVLNISVEELLGDEMNPETREISHLANQLPAELRRQLLGYAAALAAQAAALSSEPSSEVE